VTSSYPSARRRRRLHPSDFPVDFGEGMALLIVAAVLGVVLLIVT
jgi:hypothetical protein